MKHDRIFWVVVLVSVMVGLFALAQSDGGGSSASDEALLDQLLGESSTDKTAEKPAEPAETVTPAPAETPDRAEVPEATRPAAEQPADAETPAPPEVAAPTETEEPVSIETPAARSSEDQEAKDIRDLLGIETEAAPVKPAPAARVEEPASSDESDMDEMRKLLGEETGGEASKLGEGVPPAAVIEEPVAPRRGGDFSMEVGPIPDTKPPQGVYEESEELVKQESREIQAMHELALGEEALMNKAYQVALTHFLNVENNLSKRLETADARRRANEGAMISQYYLAIEKMKKGELQGDQGAQAMARRAYERNRRFTAAQRLLERIDLRIEEQTAFEQRERLRRRSAPDFIKKREDTERWIQAAIQFIRVREYDQAERELKKVLAVDNMNESAIVLMKEVQRRRLKVKTSERTAMSLERMADVTETWNPRDYNHSLDESTVQTQKGDTETIVQSEAEKLIQKMESIVIPEVVFREANIHDVVEFLVEQSRAGDVTETDPQRKGVNIVLNVGDETRVNTISFSARYVSLLGAVKILTEVAGLRYTIDKNVLMIVPTDYVIGRIETRFYPVDPAVMKRLEGTGGGAAAGGGSGGGFAEGGGGFLGENNAATSGSSAGQVDLREYFRSLGVEFPKGSSISYNPGIGKLIVANTGDNLATFERIFKELNVIAPQVEIETRFVDIAQSDLEEIGLEWHLTDDFEFMQEKGSGNVPMSARPRIVIPENSSDGGFTKGLRFGTDTRNTATTGSANDPLFAVQTVLTNPELTWMIRAIEQSGHGDLLSAPKVTTQVGLEATVKIATEYIYPTEYRVEAGGAQMSDAGTMVQTPIVIPDVFETREVGVILTVLPEVSPDRSIITLTLAPEVVTEPIWYDYGYTLSDGSQVPMKMPFFKSRNASTTVKVYDGATVVLGGLISEGLTTRNDKIPYLGSLPIIGGLFRSKHTESEKRNLMIFVTARLVDPAGKPFKQATGNLTSATP